MKPTFKPLTGLILTAAVATLALAAAPALARELRSYRVVPFKSISGAQLGWTPAHVRRVLGAPDKVSGPRKRPDIYFYRGRGVLDELTVDFDGLNRSDLVDEIDSDVGPYHTVDGIRDGTPYAVVKRDLRRYPNFHCGGGSLLMCQSTKGARQLLDRNGVTQFTIGFLDRKVDGFTVAENVPVN